MAWYYAKNGGILNDIYSVVREIYEATSERIYSIDGVSVTPIDPAQVNYLLNHLVGNLSQVGFSLESLLNLISSKIREMIKKGYFANYTLATGPENLFTTYEDVERRLPTWTIDNILADVYAGQSIPVDMVGFNGEGSPLAKPNLKLEVFYRWAWECYEILNRLRWVNRYFERSQETFWKSTDAYSTTAAAAANWPGGWGIDPDDRPIFRNFYPNNGAFTKATDYFNGDYYLTSRAWLCTYSNDLAPHATGLVHETDVYADFIVPFGFVGVFNGGAEGYQSGFQKFETLAKGAGIIVIDYSDASYPFGEVPVFPDPPDFQIIGYGTDFTDGVSRYDIVGGYTYID